MKKYSQCCGYLASQQENGDWYCQNCGERCEIRGYHEWEKPLEQILAKLQEILEAINK